MQLSKLALACALTGALAACGGGSTSNGGDTPVQQTNRALDGVAAKGLIKNGVVKVFAYGADGTKSTNPVVTGRTSATDGSYSVNLGNATGLFTVEVSGDAGTVMADEVSGGDIPMPAGMVMRSLLQVDAASGTALKGYVTPFTEMLVGAAAGASGGLTTANVASAQTGVTTMLGFNPLTTKPVMVNGAAAAALTDAAEKLQSLSLAALSKLANDSSNSLGCTGTVSEKIKCVVNATAGSASLKDDNLSIPLQVQVAVRDAAQAVAANPAINKTTLTTLAGQTTFTQASVATGSTVVAPVAATKAMFASLRSNINAWKDVYKPGASGNPAESMKADFEKALAPLDQDMADWVQMSYRGLDLFKAYAANGNSGTTYVSVNDYYRTIGACFLYADAGAKIAVTQGSPANNVYCRLERRAVPGTELPFVHANEVINPPQTVNTSLTRQQFTKTIQLTPVGTSGSSFSYTARSRMETAYFNRDSYGYIRNLFIDDTKTTIGDAGTGTVDFSMSGPTINDVRIVGDMPARTDSYGVKITDKETWNVSYLRSMEADNATAKYALTGDIAAYKKNALGLMEKSGSVALLNGSYIRAVPKDGNIVQDGVKEVGLALAITGINSKVTGTLSLNNFSKDKGGVNHMPTDLKFVGSLSNGAAEFFNGTWTAKAANYADFDTALPASAGNFLKKSASFDGIFRIAGRPDLKLSLSANNPVFDVAEFSAQYEDGSNTILASGSNASPKVLNISSANGVFMQFKEGVNTVDVMKNSSKVAVFDRSTGVITYSDGSLDSLR